ncbi:hypothetical protein GJ496_000731 [Pomphorhynchus laevis]|nr:hypothetical protein GJ496_000731 [Pomphorhynchus laevis]
MWAIKNIAILCIVLWLIAKLSYPYLPNWIKFYIKWTYFILITGFVSPFLILLTLDRPRDPRNCDRVLYILVWFYQLLNVKINCTDINNLFNLKGSIVFVSNHQSAIDFAVLAHIRPSNCIVLAKMSLLYTTGLYGLLGYLCGVQFITRGNKKHSKIIMTELSAKVKKNGWRVWIYPEGTRNSTNTLGEFKKGAFLLAIDTKCPIIPIVVSNMSKFYNYEERRWLPGVLNVKCLDPIYTDSCTKEDVQLLVDKVRNNMQQCYSTIESELLEE